MSEQRSVNFAKVRLPQFWYIYNLGKYKRDANLGSSRAMPFSFHPHSIYYLVEQVCVLLASRNNHPFRSSLAYCVHIAPLCIGCTISLAFVVFEAALIYRAKSTSTLENICLWRRVAWSGDECGIIMEGFVKGESARGSVGKSAEVDETTFFFRYFVLSLLRHVRVSFSCMHAILPLVKNVFWCTVYSAYTDKALQHLINPCLWMSKKYRTLQRYLWK